MGKAGKLRVLAVVFLFFISSQIQGQKSKVYFTSDISSAGVQKVFEPFKENVKGVVAIKVHFGEEGNKNYLKPELIKDLCLKLKATLIETNVLYVSKRRYTESHIQLAKDHGFDFAPIDILDSEGDLELPVDMKHYKVVKTGSHIDNYETFIIFSHFKGHGSAGFGGAIKNVGMGMASVAGKMAMHASDIPRYNPAKCINCSLCVKECPGNAISLNPLSIDPAKCIGCGKCIGVCPQRVFNVSWRSTKQPVFLERLVEYTKAITENRDMIYITVLANISPACDCARHAPEPFMDDIGILASTDIVAIEQAAHDLVNKAYNCRDAFLKVNKVSGKHQIGYAKKLGIGTNKYSLVDLDQNNSR